MMNFWNTYWLHPTGHSPPPHPVPRAKEGASWVGQCGRDWRPWVHAPLQLVGTSTDQATLLVLPRRNQGTWQTGKPGRKRSQGLFMGPQRFPPLEVGLGSSVPGFGSIACDSTEGKVRFQA